MKIVRAILLLATAGAIALGAGCAARASLPEPPGPTIPQQQPPPPDIPPPSSGAG